MGRLVRLVAVVLLLAVCRATPAETWYVDGAVSSSGDGRSWETAFQMIQEGIDAAGEGGEVIVAEGTYVENIQFKGKNIVLTSTDPLDPKVVESTIIDGNQAGSVVTFAGTEDETCVFSGFTIRDGFARDGGGINGGTHLGDHSLAAIKNNVIRGNSAWYDGGGLVYCDGAIVGNIVAGNRACFNGGGMYDCQGLIKNNVICQNLLLDEPSGGAGLAVCMGTIEDNIITGNREEQYGGGGLDAVRGTIRNNIIAGNYSNFGGAGIAIQEGTIENNVIAGNSTPWEGGGVSGGAELIRNTIVANQAGRRGGGVEYADRGSIRDCIIWGNRAPEDPQLASSVVPTHCCIQDWTGGGEGNIADSPMFAGWPRETARWTAPLTFDEKTWQTTLVDSEASWTADDLKSLLINPDTTQPLWFVIASNTETTISVWGDMSEIIVGDAYEIYDLRVSSWSPCIDAGDPASEYANEPEPNGGRVNMGAYGNTAEATSKSPDTDSDGLPDDWELHWFGDLDQDSQGDPDGDNKSNSEEYRNGSNPTDLTDQVQNVTKDRWYLSIQDALSEAEDGDEIVVYPGLYLENVHFDGKNVLLRSIEPSNRLIVAKTVIDGNQAGSVITFDGTEDETCALSGFTIRNGEAEAGGGICGGTELNHALTTVENNIVANSFALMGGGLAYCDGWIRNNEVFGHRAESHGAGLYSCLGTIQGNTIANNSAGEDGGGLAFCGGIIRNNLIRRNVSDDSGGGGAAHCRGTIQGNVIVENQALGGGGIAGCEGTIRGNDISRNSAENDGGGLSGCSAMIQDNSITRNTAKERGGGLYGCNSTVQNNIISSNKARRGGALSECGGPILNNVIVGNHAHGFGGGLADCGMATIQNNLVVGNEVGTNGGGGGLYECNGIIRNNTIVSNRAGEFGGGLGNCRGETYNCIIWGNSAPEGSQLHRSYSISFCCIQGLTGGGTNIGADPSFVAPGHWDDNDTPDALRDDFWVEGDYHLRADSPCLDSGMNEPWMWDTFDLDGNYRRIATKGEPGWNGEIDYVVTDESGGITLLWKGFVDMGAYECQVLGPVTETFTVYAKDNMDSGDWIAVFTGNASQWTDKEASARQRFYRVTME